MIPILTSLTMENGMQFDPTEELDYYRVCQPYYYNFKQHLKAYYWFDGIFTIKLFQSGKTFKISVANYQVTVEELKN